MSLLKSQSVRKCLQSIVQPGIWRHLLLHSGIIRENLNKTSAIKTTTRESSSQKRTDKATFQSIWCQWPVVMATSQLTASILLQWWWRPSFGICKHFSSRIFYFLLLPNIISSNYIISWYLQTLSQQQDLSFQDIETQASQLAIQLPPMRLISKGIFMCMTYHPLFAKHHSLTTVHLDHNSKINTFRRVARPRPLTSGRPSCLLVDKVIAVLRVLRETPHRRRKFKSSSSSSSWPFLVPPLNFSMQQLFWPQSTQLTFQTEKVALHWQLSMSTMTFCRWGKSVKTHNFENFSKNCWNSLKSCLPAQLTVFYRGFLGRKLLIQVRLIR